MSAPESVAALRNAAARAPGDPARQSPDEWKRQLAEFLNDLANWSSGDERDCYHQKAILYETLLETLPPGDLSDSVIESFVGFLKSSNLQRQSPVEWLWRARSMVNRVRPSHPGEAAKLLAAYRSSGNIVLMLVAMLDQVAPASPDSESGAPPR